MISAPNKKRSHTFRKGEKLSAAWCQKVENFISTFRVISGGHFFFDGRNAVLQGFGGGGRWTGRIFFGGKLVRDAPVGEVKNTHIAINLRTGQPAGDDNDWWAFWDEEDEGDLAEIEYYSVATRTNIGTEEAPEYTYALNSHTCGDIRCRIT